MAVTVENSTEKDELRVIEITIRGNTPNSGKTILASRLARVIRNEFHTPPILIDNVEGDIDSATDLLNMQGPPALTNIRVLIIDDNGPIAETTIQTIKDNEHLVQAVSPLPAVQDEGTRPI